MNIAHHHLHPRLIATLALTAAIALVGCGSDGTSKSPSTSSAPSVAPGSTAPSSVQTTTAPPAGSGSSLAGVCPDTISVQTDWYPESEHAEFYELTGQGAVQDNNTKRYTSPLYTPDGIDTGVKIEIRAGGPAIGFQQATAQMYSDPGILIAVVAMDQAIQNSAKFPTTAIIAPRRLSPQIIMWDPATHPTFKTIADIGKTDTRVLYFGGAAYMDYLTGSGVLQKSQVDGSYDGSPANFVSSGGSVAQQGYATAEPFQYQNEITQWAKPVAYQLIADTGYNPFPADAVKPESIAKYADCFTRLVPMLQRAEIAYLASPQRVNQLVSKLTTDYGGAPYTVATADYAAKVQVDTGIVGNVTGTGFGGFDTGGIQKLIDIASPILTAQGTPPAAGLTPEQLATNQFIDTTVTLPG